MPVVLKYSGVSMLPWLQRENMQRNQILHSFSTMLMFLPNFMTISHTKDWCCKEASGFRVPE